MARRAAGTAPAEQESALKAEFWKERWEQDQLGWHQDAPNERLVREWPGLGVDTEAPVFVPLCGKSLDMRWLRERGHPVVGCELSPIACRDFFAEAEIEVDPTCGDDFTRYEAEGYRLHCGDFFGLASRDLEGVRGVFDRGSLIALPPDMRRRYATHMAAILPETVRVLLLTVEYDQSVVGGPPHSVPASEVEALFGDAFSLDLRYRSEPAPPQHPRFAAAGLEVWQEAVWVLERGAGLATGRIDR